MSALILKDLYIMKKYCRSVLLMVVIFWGASIFADSGNLFWTFFPVIVGSVTPATLLSYDEKFRWNQYCDTMPISRAAVVAEKYVLTAATVLLLTAGSVAVLLMASGRTGEAPDDLGLIAALTFTVGLLPPCVMQCISSAWRRGASCTISASAPPARYRSRCHLTRWTVV